ncbi:MAG: SDR family oxidoreductase [Phycisphaerae bacterium]|nr:SDR family oxidoreductase [Phycisphaerae bacterium]
MNDALFDVSQKRVVITGAAGVLCGSLARGLARRGATLGVLDIADDAAATLCEQIRADDATRQAGGEAHPFHCNVLEAGSIETAYGKVRERLGGVDVLINGAGGNKAEATCVPPDSLFFDLSADAIRWVFDLNCMGTILPSQVFGRHLAEQGSGCIVNVSSMNAFRPLTRIAAYSAAKAAVSNFTQWLSTYMAQSHNAAVRVNAIAPGFFLTEQNRFLLTNEDGSPTARGRQIIDHTPMGRYGHPDDLLGTVVWLISDAASFVTGIVVPVDGGFSAYSGV